MPRTVPLCGNSIGTDRRFLAAYLPEIEEFLHYRSVDVSTLKELIKRWNPALLAAAPRKAEGHRALDDIRESLAELQYYRDALLPDRSRRLTTVARRGTDRHDHGTGRSPAQAGAGGGLRARSSRSRRRILRLQLPIDFTGLGPRQHLRHRGRAGLHARRPGPARRRVVGGPPRASRRGRDPAASRAHDLRHPLPPRPLRRRGDARRGERRRDLGVDRFRTWWDTDDLDERPLDDNPVAAIDGVDDDSAPATDLPASPFGRPTPWGGRPRTCRPSARRNPENLAEAMRWFRVPSRRSRSRRRGYASGTATGSACSHPATPTTTSACVDPSTASCSRATTCCRPSPPTSPG